LVYGQFIMMVNYKIQLCCPDLVFSPVLCIDIWKREHLICTVCRTVGLILSLQYKAINYLLETWAQELSHRHLLYCLHIICTRLQGLFFLIWYLYMWGLEFYQTMPIAYWLLPSKNNECGESDIYCKGKWESKYFVYT